MCQLELLNVFRILVGVADDGEVADVEVWASGLVEVQERIGRRFSRSEPRTRVLAYLRGLLAPLERKNGWTLAEQAGEENPDGMQRLLSTADWDAGRVRDDIRDYVIAHLGASDAVLVVDETGFLKKGTRSAGVARQYSGTAGRVENCQIGVFLGYASPAGRTFIDRELYLPKAWTGDRARCRDAGVDDAVEFATKPELAITMLTRALNAGIPAGWLAGDEVYGQHPGLRTFCEDRGLPYVLAVPSNQYLWIRGAGAALPTQSRAAALADAVAPQAFRRISAGMGAKGPRIYAWARVGLHPRPPGPTRRWLLVRRNPTTGERAYYLCHARTKATLSDLVRVAGTRWAIEETFQTSKGEVGLDHYQVRRYDGWYRHITLAMFAHAFLTVTRATAGKKGHPTQT